MRGVGPFLAAIAVAAVTLCGCAGIPRDPDGTLDTVRGAALRAGVSPSDGLLDVRGDEPAGDEADAIRAFAESLDAEVRWTIGSEESLVRGLEEGELDLVAGGITEETPWVDRAGVTRPYRELTDDSGRTRALVMLVPLGENAFLSELEAFLPAYVEGKARR